MIRLHDLRSAFLRYLLAVVVLVLGACHPQPTSEAGEPIANETDSKGSDADLIPVADLRADFAELYRGLQEAHFDLFVQTPKAEFDAHYQRMLDGLDTPLDPVRARIRFQQFVARGRIGHARIDFPHEAFAEHRASGGRIVPFYFRVIDGRAQVSESYVGESPADEAEGATTLRPGDELLALEGASMDAWLDRLSRHVSAETDTMVHALLEFWFPQLLWAEIGAPESISVRVRRPGTDEPLDLEVPLLDSEALQQAAEAAPERLSLDWQAREHRLLDGGLAYLRPGPFYEPTAPDAYDPSAFGRFVDEAFESFLEAGASDLLIDLRANAGGDSSFSDLLVAWFADRPFAFNSAFRIKVSPQAVASNARRLEINPEGSASKRYAELYRDRKPGEIVDFELQRGQPRPGRRFEGRVYLLVNRHSFSNAVTVAALVQDYGFGLVLGEETSDLATTYGAMERFELPRTGIEVGFPKAHIVRPSGDLRLRGVVPDVEIETPLLEGPEDPVLLRAIEIIEERRPAEGSAKVGG